MGKLRFRFVGKGAPTPAPAPPSTQFLRPDSNVTQTSFTNGFSNIDESSASDADFAYGANNTAATLEVGLSNPTGVPSSGTSTVRYRLAKTKAGVVDGGGNSCTVTARVIQGTTIIATDSARTVTGTWTAYSWTPDLSSVTDWTNLRLRFSTSASGGNAQNARGGAVSWAELECPSDTTVTITTASSSSVAEDATLSVSLTAAGETPSWAIIGGADSGKFEISGTTLRWLSNGVKDYDAPDDTDANNTYAVTVRATDAVGNTADLTHTVTVTQVVAVTYDTTMGNGVDASGFANLPLRAGAKRFYVHSGTGNDSRTITQAQDPATPLATPGAAFAFVVDGQGDQVCLAESTGPYTYNLPDLRNYEGFSALYPTAIQSYNVASPTTEALMGRATGSARPVLSTQGGGNGGSNIALRGIKLAADNTTYRAVVLLGVANNWLVENNIFEYLSLVFSHDGTGGNSTGQVVRKNAFYGAWSPDDANSGQGVFVGYSDAMTIEDNVFYSNGKKVGVSRDATMASGGAQATRHAVYAYESSTTLVRRNLIIDPSATGLSTRGNTTNYDNVLIDCPLAIIGGLGTDYNTVRPNGVDVEIYNNIILGDADINSGTPRGLAITTGNGTNGSSAHHNLIARSRDMNGANAVFLDVQANFNQPSYIAFDNNLVYLWSIWERLDTGTFGATQNHVTQANNIWDAATSGSNVNNSGHSAPNDYTLAELCTALGLANKQALIDAAIAAPEDDWAAQIKALMGPGYGMTWA